MQVIRTKNILNCGGRLVNTEKPLVMGILNITQDSFFDGGKHLSIDTALAQTEKMLSEGVSFIDVGAQSTRPGADMIGEEAELKAAIPAIEAMVKHFPNVLISIDTFRARVADEAIHAGAVIINDVSAGDDDEAMFDIVVKHKVPYIMMHKQGNSKTMQHKPSYNDVVLDIINYFIPKVEYLMANGVADIILDPGFGFGKTMEHNYDLLNRLDRFKIFELPILVGMSRKKMIQHAAKTDANGALNGTTAANTIALMKGANILRVHDVKEAVEAVNVFMQMVNIE